MMRRDPETLDRLLDTALDGVAADEPTMTDQEVRTGRADLATALRTRSTPRRRRPVLVAAAVAGVAMLTAGGLLLQTLDVGGPATASAAESLNRAADLATTTADQPLAAGQYRYVRSKYRGITLAAGSEEASTSGVVQEDWIPADPSQEWLEHRADDGTPSWLPGREGQGQPSGSPKDLVGEFRALCGNFSYLAAGSPDKCANPSWSNPSAEFLAALPTDPEALYRRLVADGKDGDTGAFLLVRNTLLTGRVPAASRAQLYRALAHAPSLVVTDARANLDGATGTALGVRVGGDFQEIIVNPADGTFIGWREVLAEDANGLAAGTVRQSSATTTGVVDAVGTKPGS
ncbi:MAG: CU044_5270 family protein [Umezawaea sp.]